MNDTANEMATALPPEPPFSRALRQWLSDLKDDEDKRNPFYEKVLAAQNDLSTGSGQEACAKHAKNLSEYIQELQSTRRDRSRSLQLSTKLEPFVSSINRLMTMCSAAAQGAPFGVSLAFAGAQVVLQLVADQSVTFDKIVDIMTEIGRNLRCYDKLSVAYETSSDVQELLLDAYKALVVFWHRASQVLSRSSLRLAATNLVRPFGTEWKTCLDRLQKNSQAVLALAQATSALESRDNQKSDLTKKIAKWIIGGENEAKLLFRDDLRKSRETRQDGTCNWIFEQSSFKSWHEANNNAVAWYNAPPGSGKTVLSAAVAHHLEACDQFVYYRYTFDDGTRKTPLAALRSIALQLRTILGKIPDQVVQCYGKEVEHHAYRLQDPEITAQVVEAFIAQIPRVHIIIDGLDECSDFPKALDMFRRLVRFYTYGITKWFFTSRDESNIRAAMEGLQAIEISPPRGTIMDDISIFLDSQGEKLALRKCADCVRYWTAASEENFLYSKLTFDILCGDGVTCSDEIHEELQKFPSGLEGCYRRYLEGLTRRKDAERNLARRIFLFMVCAAKPLTANELRNALAIRMEAEYDDHQPGRVPSLELIKSLGGSLIRLEDSTGGNKNDREIRFVHKSVLDFFKEDPDRLGIEIHRTDLRYFLINEKDGNLELGRYCLKYLQFKRYQGKVDIPTVLANDDEHAFLKYSAAFWFTHLDGVDHSKELFLEVKSLFESVAFWTCLAVQIKVRPHLFARYTRVQRAFYTLGLDRGELGKDDGVVVPLPDWVELYGPDGYNIFRTFHDFVREWHEVLVSHPEASNQCQMDRVGAGIFPGLASRMSKSIRVSKIGVPDKASDLALASVFFERSTVQARITYLDAGMACWQEGPISASEPSKSDTIPRLAAEQDKTRRLVRLSKRPQLSSSGNLATWSISLRNLDVEYYYHGTPHAFSAPKSCSVPDNQANTVAGWNLVTESASASEYFAALALHFTSQNSACSGKQETDSGYDSASASASDGDWSNSDDDSDDDCEHEDVESDCLVICHNGEKPFWIPWTEQSDDRLQLSCAFHPSCKIAVFSRRLDELQVVDLATGRSFGRAIEEPAAARSSASIHCREMRFSSCGYYLYYLLVLIADDGDIGSACQVLLTILPFEEELGEDRTMRRCTEVQRLTYKFGAPTTILRAPYVLSYWDTDMLYLCLPLLSCNPKVVRFNLVGGDRLGTEEMHIQTLANPIFFPNSTPRRSPRILYHPSHTKKKDIFVLALDSLYQAHEEGGGGYASTVMEWKIDAKEGWREWNEVVDGEEARLTEKTRTYAELRGNFIAADRRFDVVVRNGLNWTKKAFLSCA